MTRLYIAALTWAILIASCGTTKDTSDKFCDTINKDIRQNLKYNREQGIFFFEDDQKMLKVESTIYFENHFDCYIGWNPKEIFDLFGKPNFYNPRYIRYYFMESCQETGEPCIFWEFILDKNKNVDCFRERRRNFQEGPE